MQWLCKTWRLNGFEVIHAKTNQLRRPGDIFEHSYTGENPSASYTENSLAFIKACEELDWNYERSTPYRSATNGSAARVVRRVKEGTSSELVQSGLRESWWADAMECYCYLRNVRPTSRWPDALRTSVPFAI